MNEYKKLNFSIINFNKENLCIKNGGKNISPHIKWDSEKISNKQSYALIMEDPDAPSNFIHFYLPYISCNISEILSLNMNKINQNNRLNKNNNSTNLSKKSENKELFSLTNIPKNSNIIFGYNSLGNIGYHGPCNPQKDKLHIYIFTLYKLDGKIDQLKIESSTEFEILLSKKNINILSKDRIIYKYSINSGILL
jgi:Raf kinase inhibitor-like YbhB/YbcL family protein